MNNSSTYGKGRNPNSLANLNPKARYLGKVRCNLSLLPDTLEWLKKSGNASRKIDEMVAIAQQSDNADNLAILGNTYNQEVSESMYKQIEELTSEIERLRSIETKVKEVLSKNESDLRGYKKNSFSQGLLDLKHIVG